MLTDEERKFVKRCMGEFNGGSAKSLNCLLLESGISSDSLKGKSPDELSFIELYHLTNACIYALGEFEFQTVTGYSIIEALNFNLKFAGNFCNIYTGCQFKC